VTAQITRSDCYALVLPICVRHDGNALRVGSTSSGENTTIAEIRETLQRYLAYTIARGRAALPCGNAV